MTGEWDEIVAALRLAKELAIGRDDAALARFRDAEKTALGLRAASTAPPAAEVCEYIPGGQYGWYCAREDAGRVCGLPSYHPVHASASTAPPAEEATDE
jgi:hypothetical protein